jgi:hypothetical protein
MNLLDAAAHELAFCGSGKIQMGPGLSLYQHCRIAGGDHFSRHIGSNFVAADPDGGSDPGPQGARILSEVSESLPDEASGQTPPARMDGSETLSTLDHDGNTVGGRDRQGRSACSGRQGVGLTAITFLTGLDNECRVNLAGPGEPQAAGVVDNLGEGSLTLSHRTLAEEDDPAVATCEGPCPETGSEPWCGVVSGTHGQVANLTDSILAWRSKVPYLCRAFR